MESLFIQNIRYKLQKRVRRLNGAEFEQFLFLLKEFWIFLDDSPLLSSMVQELLAKVPDYMESVARISSQQQIFGENEAESAAIGCGVLSQYAEQGRPDALFRFVSPLDVRQMLDRFRTRYLDPFYEYLDEHLDDRSYVLSSLIRYKHACEWFRRQQLYAQWEGDTKRGEHLLALNMYEYLHERGIEFHIQPTSASGEPDMISLQAGSHEPLIADAKVFNSERNHGKSYLIRGFHQVYRYACDYNEAIGYLIIFNTSARPIRFVLRNPTAPVPQILFNHKTIFLLEIDLFPHAETASKRGVPDAVEITEDEMVATPQAEPGATA
jgi:hypothetical protein